MAAKKLEPNSEYANYDTDGDGVVTDDELETSQQLQELRLAARQSKCTARYGLVRFVGNAAVSDTDRSLHVCRFRSRRRYLRRYSFCVFCSDCRFSGGVLRR